MLENETLRRQIEELRCLFPMTEHVMPSYLQFHHVERKNSFVDNGVVKCPSLTRNCSDEKADSDTTLQLGLPSDVNHKKKTPEKKTFSNDFIESD